MENKNEKQVTGTGIVALIFGIIGLIIYPIFMGIVALVFGIASAEKDGLGVAGIILGIIDIIIGLVFMAAYSGY